MFEKLQRNIFKELNTEVGLTKKNLKLQKMTKTRLFLMDCIFIQSL